MAHNAAARAQSSRLVPALFVFSLLVIGGVFLTARFLIEQNRIDATRFFGGQMPTRLKTLMALQLEGGELVELFDAANQHKVSLLIASGHDRNTAAFFVPNVVHALDQARLGKVPETPVSPVILKYANAQLNVLSAGNIADIELQIAGTPVQAQRFETTKQAKYIIGVLNLPRAQLFYLFMKKGEAVDAVYAGQILGEMPLVQAALKEREAPL